jgi:acyl-CoA thioester hydrolase
VPELFIDYEVRPAFFDVDPMAVVWHGHYVRYFELARQALMERFGYSYLEMRDSGFMWPVVDLRLKYVKSAVLGQRLIVRAEITEWENRLKVDYRITDAATGDKLTVGHTIQVAVAMNTNELQYVCPPVLWEKLGVTP